MGKIKSALGSCTHMAVTSICKSSVLFFLILAIGNIYPTNFSFYEIFSFRYFFYENSLFGNYPWIIPSIYADISMFILAKAFAKHFLIGWLSTLANTSHSHMNLFEYF